MNEEFTMVAKTMYGLEDILAKEIESLGGKNIQKLRRAVSFTGNMKTLYRMNYALRTALCILKPIMNFTANNEQELYNNIYNFKWEKLMNPDGTLLIDSSVSSKIFNHSLYVSQKCKDAICDRFRKMFMHRPSVDKIDPDLRIDVHIGDRYVTVSLNSSGEPLFKRGYRQRTAEAPLNEVTAAGLIQLSGWKKDCNFYDPMCGSGTIAIEAAMYANNIPAQYYRKDFAFKKWSEFNSLEWKLIKEEQDRNIAEFDYDIWASDVSGQAIDIAKENITKARLQYDIHLFRAAIEEGEKPEGKCLVIINPPYGERLEVDDIIGLYERIGDTFKQKYEGCTAYVLSSDIFALKKIGLRPSQKIELYNGNLECRVFKFEMYQGSKKEKYSN
ncbi:MAG: class I SAM-dependent RNA methyltransferase [Bacteroidales bacterium]|nr:class I SAM-dependent RNA methyltransferase [Bacteroidales bacterium]